MPGSSEHLHKLVCIGLARFLATSYRTATRFEVAFLRTDEMKDLTAWLIEQARKERKHLETERRRQIAALVKWEAKRNGR